MKTGKYSDQIFINCPFDEQYVRLFRAIVFAIHDCGFIPRCSLEEDDATEFRLRVIVKLIKQCKYGVHDLSRVEVDNVTGLPRFNMPFELGIFYAAKTFGQAHQRSKRCIILERRKYRYRAFISDLSGVDIKDHDNSIRRVITRIRNRLIASSRRTTIPFDVHISLRYQAFERDFRRACRRLGIDPDKVSFVDLSRNITDWLSMNPKVRQVLFG
ncbi:MAG: hypothetical protein WCE90_10395 [Candidatus Zixiibacteriota bacterium]